MTFDGLLIFLALIVLGGVVWLFKKFVYLHGSQADLLNLLFTSFANKGGDSK